MRRPLTALAAVLALAGGASAAAAAQPSTLADATGVQWSGNFDTGSIPPWTSTDLVGGTSDRANQYRDVQMDGNSRALNNAPRLGFDTALTRRPGGRSLHIVGRGTTSTGTSAGTKRAQFRAGTPPFRATSDGNATDRWVGFSMYLGAGYDCAAMTASRFHNVWGWRQFGSGASFYLTVQNGNCDLVLRRSTGGTAYPDSLGADQKVVGKAKLGAWTDIVIHSKLSTTSRNALRQVWVNGVPAGQQTSANVVTTSDDLYMRLGLYTNSSYARDRHLYFDNVRIGGSYAGVNPADGAAPSPTPTASPSPTVSPTPTPTASPTPTPSPSSARPVFLGASTATDSGTGQDRLTLTPPAAARPGSTLLAAVSFRGNPATVGVPAGWVLAGQRVNPANLRTNLYRHTCPAAGCAPATFTTSSSSDGLSGALAAYSGVGAVGPVGTQANASSTLAPAPSVLAGGGLLVTVHSSAGQRSATQPAGMTERADVADPDGTYNSSIALYDQPVSAGSSGDRVARLSAAAASNGITAVLTPKG